MVRMHADEIEVSEALVRHLLEEQFAEWAALPLRRFENEGTDNAIFRIGDDLSARLPRRNGPTQPGSKESQWLGKIAPFLRVDIPLPVAQGRPSEDYPWFWEILTWVPGETVPVESIDALQVAQDLCDLIKSLRVLDPTGAPLGRGVNLAERDKDMRYWFEHFEGDPAAREEWDRAVAAPTWDGPPSWHHGDLDYRNWVVRNGRITGVIDWASMGVGDPACDIMVAWKLHSTEARDFIQDTLHVDAATWQRARGWVISQAVAILAYYTPKNNPTLFHEAESWLELALSERR